MSERIVLALSGDQYACLQDCLFPGDGFEAVALLLCGHRRGDRRHRVVVREVHGIPYDECTVRSPTKVTWHPDYVAPLLERAADEGLAVIKVHSHPSGYAAFSETDDRGDRELLPMISGWLESCQVVGSVVMLPDGQMFGRVLDQDRSFRPIDCISVAADDLLFWYSDAGSLELPSFVASHAQAFDEGTIERLQRLSIGVVGASGTGSPLIEQLMRLGVGEIVIVDDDLMEDRNVNRIVNSTACDAAKNRPKVEVLSDAIRRADLGTKVVPISENLWNPEVVRSIAQCDVLFGCMDSVDGRFLLNAISAYYCIPYFDIGVRLVAGPAKEGSAEISEVCGTIHYLRPGRSSLISRELFSMQDVAEAGLRRNDPEAHGQQVRDGYIRGAEGHRPAVISVNMFASSLAVNEFLARIHPYREEPNEMYAETTFSLASMELFYEPEVGICPILGGKAGYGDVTPLLNLLELAEARPSC